MTYLDVKQAVCPDLGMVFYNLVVLLKPCCFSPLPPIESTKGKDHRLR